MKLRMRRIDNYKSGDYESPIIEITNEENETSEDPMKRMTVKGYISFFRYYKFQISGTIDGEMDLGSSDHFRMALYVNDPEMFKIKLVECINSYLNTNYGYNGYNRAYEYGEKIYFNEYDNEQNICIDYSCDNVYDIEDEPWFEEFINDGIEYIKRYYANNRSIWS